MTNQTKNLPKEATSININDDVELEWHRRDEVAGAGVLKPGELGGPGLGDHEYRRDTNLAGKCVDRASRNLALTILPHQAIACGADDATYDREGLRPAADQWQKDALLAQSPD